MKRSKLFYLLGLLVVFAMVSVSCTKEGPAGPAGANGTNGVDGVDGVDGADGADGTAGCVQCHDADATIVAIQFQWENSAHNAGSALSRSSNGSCSPCHSGQGLSLSGGTITEGVPVNNPTTINCYTCHNIHQTYTAEDLSFTWPDVPEWVVTYGKTVDVDYGKGNLCVHCHQSRPRDPVVDMNDLSIMYSNISTHYGPHYSPQGNVLGGFGAYELEGSTSYGDGSHAHTDIVDACVKCHLSYSTANGSGGHNFRIDAPGDLEMACTPCHDDGAGAEDTYNEWYEEAFATINHGDEPPTLNTTSYIAVLGDLLVEKGVLHKEVDSVDGAPEAVEYSIVSGLEINGTLTAALFNFMYAEEDHSHGVHNPKYIKALLKNSAEAVEALDK